MGHKSNRATKEWVKRVAGHKGNKRRRGTRRTGEKGRTGKESDGCRWGKGNKRDRVTGKTSET